LKNQITCYVSNVKRMIFFFDIFYFLLRRKELETY